MVNIGDRLPPFIEQSHLGQISFEDYADGFWTVLFCTAGSFDPVAATVSLVWKQRPSPLLSYAGTWDGRQAHERV